MCASLPATDLIDVPEEVGRIFVDPAGAGTLELFADSRPTPNARARCAASMSQTLSPTTKAPSIPTCNRAAAARNRSGSGLPYFTWSRVTIGILPTSISSFSSSGRAVSRRPLVAIAQGIPAWVR
jgi:hypothetical protein